MTSTMLSQIVDAVLYEGYILYPYRPSSKKNRRERFTFGRVYPKEYSEFQRGAEHCLLQTECLLQSRREKPTLEVTVRFLQPLWREAGYGLTDASFRVVPELSVDGTLYQTWQEATEREIAVSLGPLETSQSNHARAAFSFAASRALEPIGGNTVGAAIRRRHEALDGVVEVQAESLSAELFKISVRVRNLTAIDRALCDDQDAVIMRTFASTHTILRAGGGDFVSLMDPPPAMKELAAHCKNIGTWPVLIGDEQLAERDMMLSSPIILYDYPKVAPQSNGSFFDGTEIDEMLTLRVLTMTDSEKMEMRQVDECARRILERTEAVGAQDFLKLHGTMREKERTEEFFNPAKRLECVFVDGRELRAGTAVRIRPKNRADAMDMILAGKTAVVEAVEQDAEGNIHLAVVVDDDPGKDLGMARQPGHRFFYTPEEIELIGEVSA